MAEPALVADCIKAMQDVVSVPVTVKHRLGLEYDQNYGFVRDFVGKIYDTGCRVFVVHARNAVLKGLSPKDNRDVPPLRYDDASKLKADFPDALIVLNGGLNTQAMCDEQLRRFDGVMLGRAPWHDPLILGEISEAWWPELKRIPEEALVEALVQYADRQVDLGVPLRIMVRPLLGLFNGRPNSRLWRQTLSDAKQLNGARGDLIRTAWKKSVRKDRDTLKINAYTAGSWPSAGQSRIYALSIEFSNFCAATMACAIS